MGLTAVISGSPVETTTLFASIEDVESGDGSSGDGDAPAGLDFYKGYEWRFLFTDLHSVITTWATDLQTDRKLSFALGQAATIDMSIKPDDFRVNGLWTDGYPRVAQSNRMIYGFRREGKLVPWVCRAAGILMQPNDEGDADVSASHLVAYDPRKLLEARPAMDSSGALPGPDGFRVYDTTGFATGAVIGLTMLKNTIDSPFGGMTHIDAGEDWGGTSFWNGTIDSAALQPEQALDLSITQGQSVADVWDAIEQAQNCDFILRPIYDPINRPGYTHELSVYRLAGVNRRSAVFAWDRLNRSVAHISRLHDATPGSFFNVVQYFAGQGGPPVPATGPLVNGASVSDFGRYWAQQFFPSLQTSVAPATAVLALARQALQMVKQGKRTITINTVTERAPVPLLSYELGDRVVVRATKRLRVTSDGLQRVQAIPIEITDNGVENCVGLLTSPDYLNLDPVETRLVERLSAAPVANMQRLTMQPLRIAPFSYAPNRNQVVRGGTSVELVTLSASRARHIVQQPRRTRP